MIKLIYSVFSIIAMLAVCVFCKMYLDSDDAFFVGLCFGTFFAVGFCYIAIEIEGNK